MDSELIALIERLEARIAVAQHQHEVLGDLAVVPWQDYTIISAGEALTLLDALKQRNP